MELGATGYVKSVSSEVLNTSSTLLQAAPDVVNSEIIVCPSRFANDSLRGTLYVICSIIINFSPAVKHTFQY